MLTVLGIWVGVSVVAAPLVARFVAGRRPAMKQQAKPVALAGDERR